MARNRGMSGNGDGVKPDMTPLIDVVFQLITFFVMIMTIAKDEMAQKIHLPLAPSADILIDDQIPDSININVGHISWANGRPYLDEDMAPPNSRKLPTLLTWGLLLDMNRQASWTQFRLALKRESNFAKQSAKANNIDYKAEGLPTTVIVRLDEEVEFEVFRKVMDLCREVGFTKYQLKARDEED